MNRQELIEYCLTFTNAYEDYPFDDVADENATAVMRHRSNKKSFALIMRHNGQLYLNLKCDPLEADFLRQAFKDEIPAYHQNKQHWNTIIIGGDVPVEEIKRQIVNSFDLTKLKMRKQKSV